MKTFRFDDVCINADMTLINSITDFIFSKFPDCKIIYGISPLVHDMHTNKSAVEQQRIFPKILNAHSDYRNYYMVDKAGLPDIEMHPNIILAGHGLVHVDHRLLDKAAQEMSILVSCSLVKAKIFIPPFNKWNKNTEDICAENNICLIKFEHGWLSMEHNEFDPTHDLWYLHARELTMQQIEAWFK